MPGPSIRFLLCASVMVLFLPRIGPAAAGPQTPGARERPFVPVIEKTDEGIAFVSAGIGFDSRTNLPRFSLKLIFANRTSKYLADIDVEIKPGPGGQPVRIHSPGPWLLVDLAPGKYAVSATTSKGHRTSTRVTVVRGRVLQAKMVWDLSDDEI